MDKRLIEEISLGQYTKQCEKLEELVEVNLVQHPKVV